MEIVDTIYNDSWGRLDPWVLSRMDGKSLLTEIEANADLILDNLDFASLRDRASHSIADNFNIIERDRLIPCAGRSIPARIYQPERLTLTNKCLVFIHGGGFYSGNLNSFNKECRYLSQKGQMTVVALEYRLAPESPFPAAYKDVTESLSWLINDQSKLGLQEAEFYLAGDSAGGNLCVVAGLSELAHHIKQIFAIYPALDITKPDKTVYHWSYDNYQMSDEEKPFILSRLNKFVWINRVIALLYPNGEELSNPLISPVYAKDLSSFPKLTLFEAEFDYYLQSNRYFAKRLSEVNKEVEEIVYKGMDHGFFDRSGSQGQAEDIMNRIVQTILK